MTALCAVLGTCAVARAQSVADAGFNPGANNIVWSMAVQPDGKIVVGGWFTTLGGGGTGTTPRNYIGRLNADGSIDSSFNPGANGSVIAMAVQPDGKILVGGGFTMLGGGGTGTTPRNYIGRLNADGSLDASFNPGANVGVWALAVQADGKILVGGGFTTLGGGGTGTTPRNYIGRLNADGSLDTSFNPGANSYVYALAVQPDAKILVGGGFWMLGGGGTGTTPRSAIGRLNADGSLDASFDPGANNSVWALAVQPDGKIVVGGEFTTLGGGGTGTTPRIYIGRINANGSLDASFNPGADSIVYVLSVQPDGKILVCGNFQQLAGTPRNYIGRLNADGSLDANFNPGADKGVNAAAVQADGKIVVGGFFTTLGGGGLGTRTRNYIGRLAATEAYTLTTTTTGSGTVTSDVGGIVCGATCSASYDSGSAVVLTATPSPGFLFAGWSGGGCSGTGTCNLTITAATAVRADFLAINACPTITLSTTTFADGTAGVAYLATTITQTGAVGATFAVTSGALPSGLTLSSAGVVSGTPIEAGAFTFTVTATDANGCTGSRTYSLTIGGAVSGGPPSAIDDGFNPGANDTVVAVALQPDGKILVGGHFTALGGGTGTTTRNHIGRLNTDGSLETSFNPGANNSVYAVAVQPDGKILVTGGFTTLGGGGTGTTTRNYLGRLNADGSLDASFNPGANNAVFAVAVQPDGKILVAGVFTTLGGGGTGTTSRNYLGRLNADGSLDASFNPGANNTVYAVAVQPDGKILVGGGFTTLGGGGTGTATRNYLGRLNADGTLESGFNPAANGPVRELALQADGKILIGGAFTTLGGAGTGTTVRNRIGRLHPDGSLDASFDPGADGTIYALVEQGDGQILVGGAFTTLGGGGTGTTTRNRIGRLNADGTLDSSFDPGANNEVQILVAQPDGKVLVGGAFTMLGGGGTGTTPRSYLGRLATGGSSPSVGGQISGIVTHATSGVALAGVSVTLYDSLGNFAGTASTSSAGLYTSATLSAGSYFLRTSNSLGLINELFDNINCASGCSVLIGTPIPVVAGATTTANLALAPVPAGAGRVSGKVISDSSAAGLANVAVFVFNTSGLAVTSSLTNSTGDYTTDTLPDGSYYMRTFNEAGYVDEVHANQICLLCQVTELGTPVVVTAPNTTIVNFSLAASGRMTGTITDSGGLPLASISVSVYTPTGSFVTRAETDASGKYATLDVIPAGSYFVLTGNTLGYINQVYRDRECLGCNPSTGTAVVVVEGQPIGGVDFALTRGGRVTGTVTAAASGAAVPGVTVRVATATGTFVASGYTDAAGRYVTDTGLPSGTYYARTSNSVGFVDEVFDNVACASCAVTVGAPIVVTAGSDASGVDFALAMSGGMTGLVVDAATSQPITGARVEVFSAGGALLMSALTDGVGRYLTGSGLGAGKYFLRASSPQEYVAEVYNDLECAACSPITGTPVTIVTGQTTLNVNFSLARGGGITGAVTEAGSGRALADVTVLIYNANNNLVTSALTDTTGHFASGSRLPSGTYFARTSNSQGYVDQVYNGEICVVCTPNTRTGIAVTAGQVAANIAFQLSPGARLAGTVIETGSNTPLAGVTVAVYNTNGVRVTSGVTDNASQYQTAAGLTAGTYFARTTNGLGYIDKIFDNAVCLACDPTRGTRIVVTGSTVVPGVNFSLSPGGRIAGAITAAGTGAAIGPAIGNVQVSVYSAAGALVGESSTNSIGKYVTSGLPPGSYRLRTFNKLGFIDEAFDNLPCAPCAITEATPVAVTGATAVGGTNFALESGGWVSGWVTDAATRAPLAGVIVAFLQNGAVVARSSPSDASGYYGISLPVGTYAARPDPVQGYIVQLASGLRPAAVGNVSVKVGLETPGVDFPLAACTPPAVTPATLPPATAGVAYSQSLTGSGGTLPHTFSLAGGALPPGLSLNEKGQIIGTPTTLGTANFTVAVTDASQCSATQTYAQFTCGVTLGETSATFAAAGFMRQVTVAANSSDCGWSASSSDSWVTITKGSGTGAGTLEYAVAANPTTAQRTASITVGSQTYTVIQNGQPQQTQPDPPIGTFDTPLEGSTVTGSIAVTGWTLSKAGIDRVEIWRDLTTGETTTPFNSPGHPGHGKVFIARATFVRGARPDVAATYPSYPNADRGGWGYLLLTQGLWNVGNGTFRLYAFAYDVDGQSARLGTKTITANNAQSIKPFGALDTPAYGATVSGGFWNYGWALTPNGNTTDPRSCVITDGNIYVGIDSQPIVAVHYGDTRTDIAGFFPGFSNGNSAGGAYYIDTTALGNGDHQIGWYVVDSCGRADGIGSRIFTVLNGVNITTDAAPRVLPTDDGSRALRSVRPDDASSTAVVQVFGPAASDDPAGSDVLRVFRPAGTNDPAGSDVVRVFRPAGADDRSAAYNESPMLVHIDQQSRWSYPDEQGVHVITIAQRSRIEVELPKVESALYRGGEIVGGTEKSFPLGSSLDAARGLFYWEPAPAFLGSYELVFAAGDSAPIRVRVVVEPADGALRN